VAAGRTFQSASSQKPLCRLYALDGHGDGVAAAEAESGDAALWQGHSRDLPVRGLAKGKSLKLTERESQKWFASSASAERNRVPVLPSMLRMKERSGYTLCAAKFVFAGGTKHST
jgi:hypothetical protein